MVLTDRDDIRVAGGKRAEELLTFDVSDDALERTASVGIGLSVVTLNFGTGIVAIRAALREQRSRRGFRVTSTCAPSRHCPALE